MSGEIASSFSANATSKRVKTLSSRVGEPGRDELLQRLSVSIAEIEPVVQKIQTEYGWGWDRFESGLQLIDGLELQSRSHVSLSIFETVKAQLAQSINQMNQEQLLQMLAETYPYMSVSELSIVPLQILKRLVKVPVVYLEDLVKQERLSDLPLGIRQQAWEINESVFLSSVDAACKPYQPVADFYKLDNSFFKKICEFIGHSATLRRSFFEYCCRKSLEGGISTYGTFLARVVLELNNINQSMGKAKERLIDLVFIIERCRRHGQIDRASVSLIVSFIENLIGSYLSQLEQEYQSQETEYRGYILAEQQAARRLKARPPAAASSSSSRSAFDISVPTGESRIDTVCCDLAHGPTSSGSHTNSFIAADFDTALRFLERMDVENIFGEEVTDANAPGYSRLIKKPMYLNLIRHKIDTGKYQSLSDMDDDVQLMFLNCQVFNGESSYYGKIALRFNDKWNKAFAKWTGNGEDEEELDFSKAASATGGGNGGAAKRRKQSSSDARNDTSSSSISLSSSAHGDSEPTAISHDRASAKSLKDTLYTAYKMLDKWDPEQIFKAKVTDAIAPGYSSVIRKPMYLRLIKSRIEDGEYDSLGSLDEDVQLMYNNCIRFNGKDTYYGKFAWDLTQKWAKMYIRLGGIPADSASSSTSNVSVQNSNETALVEAPKLAIASTSIPAVGAALVQERADESHKNVGGGEGRGVGGGSDNSDTKQTHIAQLVKPVVPKSELSTLPAPAQRTYNRLSQFPADTALKHILSLAVEFLTNIDVNGYFMSPVTDKIAKGYSSIIKYPICIADIRRKQYTSMDLFSSDVELIVRNCCTYNQKGDIIYESGVNLQSWWNLFADRAKELFKSCTRIPPAPSRSPLPPTTTAATPAATPATAGMEASETGGRETSVLPTASGSIASATESTTPTATSGASPVKYPASLTYDGILTTIKENVLDPSIPLPTDISALCGPVLRAVLLMLWDYLTALDVYSFFAMPVGSTDYLRVVTHPMDLSTVRVKIDRKKYKSLQSMDDDLAVMFDNCSLYNEKTSIVVHSAELMRKAWNVAKSNINVVLSGDESNMEAFDPVQTSKELQSLTVNERDFVPPVVSRTNDKNEEEEEEEFMPTKSQRRHNSESNSGDVKRKAVHEEQAKKKEEEGEEKEEKQQDLDDLLGADDGSDDADCDHVVDIKDTAPRSCSPSAGATALTSKNRLVKQRFADNNDDDDEEEAEWHDETFSNDNNKTATKTKSKAEGKPDVDKHNGSGAMSLVQPDDGEEEGIDNSTVYLKSRRVIDDDDDDDYNDTVSASRSPKRRRLEVVKDESSLVSATSTTNPIQDEPAIYHFSGPPSLPSSAAVVTAVVPGPQAFASSSSAATATTTASIPRAVPASSKPPTAIHRPKPKPVVTAALESYRAAVEVMRQNSTAMAAAAANGKSGHGGGSVGNIAALMAQSNGTTSTSSAAPPVRRDLPVVLLENMVMEAVVVLRAPPVQGMLRQLLSSRVLELMVSKNRRAALPADDQLCRHLVQIIQFSLYNHRNFSSAASTAVAETGDTKQQNAQQKDGLWLEAPSDDLLRGFLPAVMLEVLKRRDAVANGDEDENEEGDAVELTDNSMFSRVLASSEESRHLLNSYEAKKRGQVQDLMLSLIKPLL